jgi:hypothetical protein
VLTPDRRQALREISEALVAHLTDAPVWPVDGDPGGDAGGDPGDGQERPAGR